MEVIAGGVTRLSNNRPLSSGRNEILQPAARSSAAGGVAVRALEARDPPFERREPVATSRIRRPALDGLSLPCQGHTCTVGTSGARQRARFVILLTGLYGPHRRRDPDRRAGTWHAATCPAGSSAGGGEPDTFLFMPRCAENIRLRLPAGPRGRCCRPRCGAGPGGGLIAETPQGLARWCGSGGYRLSGGQRQRISLGAGNLCATGAADPR